MANSGTSSTDSTDSIEIGNCRLRFTDTGDGEAVLVLHGAGGSRSLEPVVETMSEKYRVILPDHPGFGRTEASNWIESVSDLAYMYLDVIDKLALGRVHLLGHSLGGWVAAEICVRSTRKIASLSLISTAGIHLKGVKKGDVFLWSPEEAIRNLFAVDAVVAAELARDATADEVETMVRNRAAAAKYAWSPRFYNPDLEKWLHRIDVPALVLWGAEDRVFPAAYATAFGKLIPNAKVEILEDCGHLPFVDRPDAFFRHVSNFIAGATVGAAVGAAS